MLSAAENTQHVILFDHLGLCCTRGPSPSGSPIKFCKDFVQLSCSLNATLVSQHTQHVVTSQILIYLTVVLKQFLYRPEQVLRVPGG
jgi:hypothetical protein